METPIPLPDEFDGVVVVIPKDPSKPAAMLASNRLRISETIDYFAVLDAIRNALDARMDQRNKAVPKWNPMN